MGNLGVLILIFCFIITILPNTTTSDDKEEVWLERVCKGEKAEEEVVKFHFYIQDVVGGPNTTVYIVIEPNITSASPSLKFGIISVVDDLITEGPDPNSKEVGRIQGIISSTDPRVLAVTINLNVIFTTGKYNGSTLIVLGRNQMLLPKREMSIVGGTGVFAMARGRYFQTTYSDGVLDTTLYVVYAPEDIVQLADKRLIS